MKACAIWLLALPLFGQQLSPPIVSVQGVPAWDARVHATHEQQKMIEMKLKYFDRTATTGHGELVSQLSQVTITPPSVTVAPKATVQFKTSAKNPRWSWTGAGALSQTGLYTAPAAVPISPFDVVQISVTDADTLQSAFATLMIIQTQPGTSQFTDAEVLALKQMVNLVLSGHWCFGTNGCSIPK